MFTGTESIDLADYIRNPFYDVLETSARRDVMYYPCCEEPYIMLVFNMIIGRNSEEGVRGRGGGAA